MFLPFFQASLEIAMSLQPTFVLKEEEKREEMKVFGNIQCTISSYETLCCVSSTCATTENETKQKKA